MKKINGGVCWRDQLEEPVCDLKIWLHVHFARSAIQNLAPTAVSMFLLVSTLGSMSASNSMRLHQLAGGDTGPGCSLLYFHGQDFLLTA